MMKSAKQGAPYLRTLHTWRCNGGHEINVDDGGWPQRLAVKQAVLKAWLSCGSNPEEPRCATCGGKVTYTHAESEAPLPADA
jgi:hypothetical protein